MPSEEDARLTASTLRDAAEIVLEGCTLQDRSAAQVSGTNSAAAGSDSDAAHAACQHE